MFRATLQNSFITLRDLEEEACKGSALRSRAISSDSVLDHRHPVETPCDQCVKAQLERLDQLMKSDIMTCPALEGSSSKVLTLNELKMRKTNCWRMASNSSVSTMAPDDVSESEHDIHSSSEASRSVRRGVSNASICSLISEDCEEHFGDDVGTATPPEVSGAAQTVRSPTDDFSHGNVPRHVNLAHEFAAKSSHSGPPTTIMIRNIPNRFSQPQIVRELERLGFAGTFDFFYAPMDKRTKCTVGYAFVNFVHPESAARCMRVMERHYFQSYGRQGQKQARVSVAHLQGLDANIKHYKNSAVTSNPSDNQNGPIIMPRIARASNSV